MILADEYEELEKEREAFAQENKFSKNKSASPAQVTCKRCEEDASHTALPRGRFHLTVLHS